MWAKHFTTKPNGEPRFAVRPHGSVHESTAYAWRPRPDVQLISLDEFTPRGDRMQLEIDQRQQSWLVQVLKRARADGVRWTLVQGHLPILGPVREGASSGLQTKVDSGRSCGRPSRSTASISTCAARCTT